ncbi:SDR family NAD(P)-dependent oxidoreductase [Asticcacaulis sp. ZE23SCel15]|uniref:SDR family NAD(P)-dependent oxidoreductase n=1 Tax=Asticcacaulis sp. ZE23SCel15 TaxID=3059027 RepID=UPI00265EEAA6|nr:SDR family NAD(P)-dependent oxidoreductase [Asticcacaulis sp. ZE23SCel15]WKL57055.1 SDR family NAD(P)-dependent oxidoreductase [Asticcacaulis sp. ZE23SCel15]
MKISNATVLVSGANRGIGAAIVRELLNKGVAKVYAGARNPATLPDFGDARVVPVKLDITDEAAVQALAAAHADIDILINNAGTAQFGTVLTTSNEAFGYDFSTNVYGTLNLLRAFTPQLVTKKSGAIVNVISVVGLVAAHSLAGYSASKAALLSITQSVREELKDSGVDVLGVFPGPIDTDMARDIPLSKATPESAAALIVAGIEAGDLYIYPDPTAQVIGATWATNAAGLEKVFNAAH